MDHKENSDFLKNQISTRNLLCYSLAYNDDCNLQFEMEADLILM